MTHVRNKRILHTESYNSNYQTTNYNRMVTSYTSVHTRTSTTILPHTHHNTVNCNWSLQYEWRKQEKEKNVADVSTQKKQAHVSQVSQNSISPDTDVVVDMASWELVSQYGKWAILIQLTQSTLLERNWSNCNSNRDRTRRARTRSKRRILQHRTVKQEDVVRQLCWII